MRAIGTVALLGLLTFGVAFAVAPSGTRVPGRLAGGALVAARGVRPPAVAAVVVGGGFDARSNATAIESDLELAAITLGAESNLYFAGGSGTRSVVESGDALPDSLAMRLRAIFDPDAPANPTYRVTRLHPGGPARWDAFATAVASALDEGPRVRPLWLAVVGHGGWGETPASVTAALWGDDTVTPVDMADLLTAGSRSARLVMTTCYSGGFAEIAFVEADRSQAATTRDVCGFFATEWDREAGGCDPDPDRARHEGFATYFFQALRGLSREGEALRGRYDFDGDGVVGGREALAYVRVASAGIDVPTSTSEVYLEAVAEKDPASRDVPAWDEATSLGPLFADVVFVHQTLGRELGLDPEAAEARLVEVQAAIAEDAARSDEVAAARLELRYALLSRWPLLDEPYHPATAELQAAEADAIEAFIETSPEGRAWAEALAAPEPVDDTLLAREARLLRFLHADRTLRWAAWLRARGGAEWQRLEAFRVCETDAP